MCDINWTGKKEEWVRKKVGQFNRTDIEWADGQAGSLTQGEEEKKNSMDSIMRSIPSRVSSSERKKN